MPLIIAQAKKIITIRAYGYRKNGFMFAINGYGIAAIGNFFLHTNDDPNSPSAGVAKIKESGVGGCSFIVVKEPSAGTFSIYVTGTYSSTCTSYMIVIPIDNSTNISVGNNVSVSSLTSYSTVTL